MLIAINYSDATFAKAQQKNTLTAYKRGGFDKVIEYSPNDLNEDFINNNKEAFVVGNSRVGKYGLWRPFIVLNTLEQMEYGDYMMYCDSGAYYTKSVQGLVKRMNRDNIDIMLFEVEGNIEKAYTKRDIFTYLNCDNCSITDTVQRCSTYFLVKKTARSVQFFKEYYQLSLEAPFLFTDEKNRMGLDNYPEFVDTRHNQSVLSVLSKKYSLPAYRDISQWGNGTGVFKIIKNK